MRLVSRIMVGSSGTSVPPPVVTPTPPVSGSAYDAVIQQNYSGGWGVELAVYKNGAPLYVHGYGLRDRGLPDVYGNYQPIADRLASFPLNFAPGTAFEYSNSSYVLLAGDALHHEARRRKAHRRRLLTHDAARIEHGDEDPELDSRALGTDEHGRAFAERLRDPPFGDADVPGAVG